MTFSFHGSSLFTFLVFNLRVNRFYTGILIYDEIVEKKLKLFPILYEKFGYFQCRDGPKPKPKFIVILWELKPASAWC